MKVAHRLIRLACLALALAAPAAALHAEPVLIAHRSLEGETFDAATIKAALLGRKVAWSNNSRVTLAVLKSGPVAEAFLKQAVEQTPSQFLTHWRRLSMTGGGIAPRSFDSEEELLRFVAGQPGAIGFIDEATADGSVLVVKPTG